MINIKNRITECIKVFFVYIKLQLIKTWNNDKSYQHIAKELIAFYIIVGLMFVTFNVFIELSKEYIVFDKFDIPDKYISKGYSSNVIINRLAYEIDNIKQNSVIQNPSHYSTVVINASSIAPSTIIISGSTLSLNTIIIYLKQIFKKPLFVISGDIVDDNSNTKLRIRLKGTSKIFIKHTDDIIADKDNNIDNMLKVAAVNLCIQIAPLETAGFLYNNKKHDEVIQICKIMSENPSHAGLAYTLWANSLFTMHKYDEAIKICQLADKLKLDINTKKPLYLTWGSILRKQGKFDISITKFKLLDQLDPNNSSTYLIIGDLLILQGNYDKAVYYLSKYIDLEKNNHGSADFSNIISNIIASINKLDKGALDSIKTDINNSIMSGICDTACK